MTAQNIAQRGRERERGTETPRRRQSYRVSQERGWRRAYCDAASHCSDADEITWFARTAHGYVNWVSLGQTNNTYTHIYYIIMVSVRHVYVSILAREARVLFLVFILFAYLKVFLFVQVRLASCNWGVHIHVIRLNSKLKPITVNNDVKSHGRYMDMKMSAFEMQMRV